MHNYDREIGNNVQVSTDALNWYNDLVDPVRIALLDENGAYCVNELVDATGFTSGRIKKNIYGTDLEKYPRLYDFIKIAYCAGYKLALVPLEKE